MMQQKKDAVATQQDADSTQMLMSALTRVCNKYTIDLDKDIELGIKSLIIICMRTIDRKALQGTTCPNKFVDWDKLEDEDTDQHRPGSPPPSYLQEEQELPGGGGSNSARL